MKKFNDVLLNEIKKLNQARRFNNSLNGQGKNEQLADANSYKIRAKLHELEIRKELIQWSISQYY